MRYMMDLNLELCVSCGACAIACMDQNDIHAGDDTPFRTIFDMEVHKGKTAFEHISLTCMHCPDAPCVTACPSRCIRKDLEMDIEIFVDFLMAPAMMPFAGTCFMPRAKGDRPGVAPEGAVCCYSASPQAPRSKKP